MTKRESRAPGVRRHLREYGQSFLKYLDDNSILENHVNILAESLTHLLKNELQDPETCERFWKGIKPALAGCPEDDHFRMYENILAYGFVHLLDRYLRVWEIMRYLVQLHVLPAPRTGPAVLDIGSGPAPALYAADHFYRCLSAFAATQGIERLAILPPILHPIELSRGMCHFFHLLSEYSEQKVQGPYGALLSDFSEFDPNALRETAKRRQTTEFYDENGWSFWESLGEVRSWANNQYRYQLVFFSNFLTAPSLVSRFQQQIAFAFGNQWPGGVVVVLGGIHDPYPGIYEQVEAIAQGTSHSRIYEVPEVFDDTFRHPYFQRIKQFNDAIWDHLDERCDTSKFDREGYPPYWDKTTPIKSLKSFAVRVYQR
jgi:hypothetical protein